MSEFEMYMQSIHHWRARLLAVGVPEVVFDDVVGRLKSWNEWPLIWEKLGDEEAAYAEEQERAGHRVTAGEGWARTTLYYHFGQFVLFDDESLRKRLARKKEVAYEKALPLMQPPGEKLVITTQDGKLYGILRRPEASRGGSGPFPVVIVLPGADSTKEEYFRFEDLLLARGLATLTVDGPGQGETRPGYPFRMDYEEAFPAVIERIRQLPHLHPEAIGLLGFSFGGYLAPRVAARCPEIKATVSLAGCYDLTYWDQLPPLLKKDIAYVIGARDDEEAKAWATTSITLKDHLPNIQGNLLIVHGTDDRIFDYRDAYKMEKEAPRARAVVYEGADHGCHNLSHHAKPMMADWLADELRTHV